jgi:predicted nucleic acid-binding Zn ribbon protein
MTGEPNRDAEIRRRQRGRALVMALVLAAFVVLMYFITIARMSGG